MKKTISINLGGQSFIIEEEAYERLSNYLNEIKNHCGREADVEEVIADIELGMAEKLSQSLTSYKNVINLVDVESLIKIMGTTEDFDREIGSSDDEGAKKESGDQVKRRLYRDLDNKLLGGVAAGLGIYFEIDPLIFRLLFFASIFAGGFGLALYLLLWLIVPAAINAHQKLEMQGEAPTLAAFERLAKKGLSWKDDWQKKWRESSWFKKIISLPFLILDYLIKAIKIIWSKLWPIAGFCLGLGISLVAIFGLGAISIASLYALLEARSGYRLSYIPIAEITSAFPFIWVLISGFLSLIIPILFLLFAGLIIIRRKNFLNFTVAAILVSIWMIAGVSCTALCLRYGPDVYNKIENHPQLKSISHPVAVSEIKKIKVSGRQFRVFIEPGATSSLAFVGRAVDLERIEFKDQDGQINISLKPSAEALCLNCEPSIVRINISAPNLNSLEVSGAEVEMTDGLNKLTDVWSKDRASVNVVAGVNNLTIFADNLAVVNLSGRATSTIFNINDGEINLDNFQGDTAVLNLLEQDTDSRISGKINNLTINSGVNVSAGSRIEGGELTVGKVILNNLGKEKIVLGRSDKIEVNTNGQSRLYYRGQPKISGELKNNKIVRYEVISENEYYKEREDNGGELNDSNVLISLNDNYYRLYQGSLANRLFREMCDNF